MNFIMKRTGGSVEWVMTRVIKEYFDIPSYKSHFLK